MFWYYHGDHLRSANNLTDQQGYAVHHYEYYAFGKDRSPSQSCSFNVSNRYTGQIFDDDTGLYYYNAAMFAVHAECCVRFIEGILQSLSGGIPHPLFINSQVSLSLP